LLRESTGCYGVGFAASPVQIETREMYTGIRCSVFTGVLEALACERWVDLQISELVHGHAVMAAALEVSLLTTLLKQRQSLGWAGVSSFAVEPHHSQLSAAALAILLTPVLEVLSSLFERGGSEKTLGV